MVDDEVDTVEDIVEDTVKVGIAVTAALDTREYMVVLACCGVHKDSPSFYY
jgi:hypothetical protein